MSKINELVKDLGEPYKIKNIDGEDCIYRNLNSIYEFEVSGSHKKSSTLYVWKTNPREVIAIYENISTDNLKDILGYYAAKYQNLLEQIRVLREDEII